MLKEDDYIEFVMQNAKKEGKNFVLDSGEGNDFIDSKNGWYIEDLSGWLIDPVDSERLNHSWVGKTAYTDFQNNYVFVKWSIDEYSNIIITFNKCDNL